MVQSNSPSTDSNCQAELSGNQNPFLILGLRDHLSHEELGLMSQPLGGCLLGEDDFTFGSDCSSYTLDYDDGYLTCACSSSYYSS